MVQTMLCSVARDVIIQCICFHLQNSAVALEAGQQAVRSGGDGSGDHDFAGTPSPPNCCRQSYRSYDTFQSTEALVLNFRTSPGITFHEQCCAATRTACSLLLGSSRVPGFTDETAR